MEFHLSPACRRHLERHFDDGESAGSYFLRDTFQTPNDLLLYLSSATPTSVIEQQPSNRVFIYKLTDGRMAGTLGLMKRSSFSEKDLARELRDGFTIDVGLVDQLELTADFCVVVSETSKGLSIITAFPGSYARPFAQKGQPAEEYALNKQFWEEHILLKQKQS